MADSKHTPGSVDMIRARRDGVEVYFRGQWRPAMMHPAADSIWLYIDDPGWLVITACCDRPLAVRGHMVRNKETVIAKATETEPTDG